MSQVYFYQTDMYNQPYRPFYHGYGESSKYARRVSHGRRESESGPGSHSSWGKFHYTRYRRQHHGT